MRTTNTYERNTMFQHIKSLAQSIEKSYEQQLKAREDARKAMIEEALRKRVA